MGLQFHTNIVENAKDYKKPYTDTMPDERFCNKDQRIWKVQEIKN
jgi:hypothetical protein